MTPIETLRALNAFHGLNNQQLEALVAASRLIKVAAGEDVVREGEDSNALHILVNGAVNMTKLLGLVTEATRHDSPKKTVVRLAAPQIFGEMALLGDAERAVSITASEPCELLELHKDAFDRLVAADVELGYRLLYNLAIVLCERVRRTERDVLKLTAALSLALGNR